MRIRTRPDELASVIAEWLELELDLSEDRTGTYFDMDSLRERLIAEVASAADEESDE